ncbi:MAG: iron-sulfur cluster assembly accessory protein [Candidatus Methylomirabilota bacterium]|nr:iron-sulfur cluster assembly accessory protein [candidate division NC10 bacterium]PWB47561.1 MAG: iron-sulfur cluster assembly accessory protein [candidate division NC10 bacterium]
MLTITESAKKKILELMKAESQSDIGVRVMVTGGGPGSFRYGLGFMANKDKGTDDTVIDAGSFKVYVDAESAPKLQGATVDFIEGVYQSGFKIDNPNSGWKDPVAAAVQRVIDTRINPGVAAHGGHVTLLEVKDGIAYIAFGGGCHGCGMADMTLKQGVATAIQEAVPEIRQVLDTTDHASGANPYYRATQSGGASLA